MRTPLAALLLVAVGCGAGPAPFHGTELPDPRPAPAVRLGGFDLAAEKGKVVLLFLGYTHCPDVCPTTLADWRRVHAGLGADTARVRFVFVSTDPARDTPEATRAYVARFHPSFTGLAGTPDEVAAIERGFMSTSYREPAPDSSAASRDPHAGHDAYLVAHTTRAFAVDAEGRWRLVLPAGASAAQVLDDVRRLLDE